MTLLYGIVYNKYVNWVWNIIKRSFVPWGPNHPVSCFVPPAAHHRPLYYTSPPLLILPTTLLFLLLFFLLLNRINSRTLKTRLHNPLHCIFFMPSLLFFYLRVQPIHSVFFPLPPFPPRKTASKINYVENILSLQNILLVYSVLYRRRDAQKWPMALLILPPRGISRMLPFSTEMWSSFQPQRVKYLFPILFHKEYFIQVSHNLLQKLPCFSTV